MPKAPSAHRCRQQKGSSLVEFSFVLLPLTGLLFLLLNVAWLLFSWACIQEGVREGVRTAITGQTDATVIAAVQKYSFGLAQNAGKSSPISVAYYYASSPKTLLPVGISCSGNIVKVSVTGIMIAPLMPLWIAQAPIGLSAASADLVEPGSTCR